MDISIVDENYKINDNDIQIDIDKGWILTMIIEWANKLKYL